MTLTVTLSEQEYEARALPELRALVDAFDALDLEGVEAELSSDILTMEFRDGSKYVMNSHRAARQIWMAAERAAWHFDWVPERAVWVAHKTGDELWSTVCRVVSAKLGQEVALVDARRS